MIFGHQDIFKVFGTLKIQLLESGADARALKRKTFGRKTKAAVSMAKTTL